MTLKAKRSLPLVFILVAFLSGLAVTLGSQPIAAYFFNLKDLTGIQFLEREENTK